jgi:hypothetical protein
VKNASGTFYTVTNRRFLYCRDCNAVHHVTPFDTAPSYERVGLAIRETPRDDRGQFMDRHSGHRIGDLISVAESCPQGGQSADPMKVTYIEVTDGRESFVLRSFRSSIADPLSYEVLPTQLMLWETVDDTEPTQNNEVAFGVPVNMKPGNSPVDDGQLYNFIQQ